MHDKFAPLLTQALSEPGIVSAAYGRFHRFSIGNQILAAIQLQERDLPMAPIASFLRWKELGRSVTKGQKALSLWMPITVKRRDSESDDGSIEESSRLLTLFRLAPRWFSLD